MKHLRHFIAGGITKSLYGVTGHALSGKVSEIHDKMLAGTMLQIFYNVRTRIYPRSQSVPRLAFFAEAQRLFVAGRDQTLWLNFRRNAIISLVFIPTLEYNVCENQPLAEVRFVMDFIISPAYASLRGGGFELRLSPL